MKYKLERKYILIIMTILLASCGAITYYYLLFHSTEWIAFFSKIFKILTPVLYGFGIAYILSPAINFMESKAIIPVFKKCRLNTASPKCKGKVRAISIVIVYFLVFMFLGILLRLIIPMLADSMDQLSRNIPKYLHGAVIGIRNILAPFPELESLFEGLISTSQISATDIQSIISDLSNNFDFKEMMSTFKSVSEIGAPIFKFLSTFGNLVLGLIISIYMLASKEMYSTQFISIIYSLFKESTGNKILKEFRSAHRTFGGFFIGKIIDSIIIGILCFILCLILGMPYAVLIAVIIGVTNVIPFFGPFLGAIPCAFLVFMVDPMKALIFLIMILALQQLDGNLIGPMVLGNSTGLSSFWVIVAITVFGGIWGVFGMFIGVPVFAVMYKLLKHYIKAKLRKKNLPDTIKAYAHVESIENGKLNLIGDLNSTTTDNDDSITVTLKVDNPEKINEIVEKYEEATVLDEIASHFNKDNHSDDINEMPY